MVWNIFVPRQHRSALERTRIDDKVAFYVSKHGPTITGWGPRPKGGQAIVCIARVTEPLTECPLHEKYTNGRTGDYAWQVSCGDHVFGRLDRARVCDILGWARNYYLHGLGKGSGLRELEAEEFEQIEGEFVGSDHP